MLRVGVNARHLGTAAAIPMAISVGLAGGLRSDLKPGTVVIATELALGEAKRVTCDAHWLETLADAAHALALPTVRGPIVTLADMTVGASRERWAQQGFTAVDMESAHVAHRAERVAAVRVVLDSPAHELSALWRTPWRAALDPRCWAEALWLAAHAPRFALRAADVLGRALLNDEIDSEV